MNFFKYLSIWVLVSFYRFLRKVLAFSLLYRCLCFVAIFNLFNGDWFEWFYSNLRCSLLLITLLFVRCFHNTLPECQFFVFFLCYSSHVSIIHFHHLNFQLWFFINWFLYTVLIPLLFLLVSFFVKLLQYFGMLLLWLQNIVGECFIRYFVFCDFFVQGW